MCTIKTSRTCIHEQIDKNDFVKIVIGKNISNPDDYLYVNKLSKSVFINNDRLKSGGIKFNPPHIEKNDMLTIALDGKEQIFFNIDTIIIELKKYYGSEDITEENLNYLIASLSSVKATAIHRLDQYFEMQKTEH